MSYEEFVWVQMGHHIRTSSVYPYFAQLVDILFGEVL